MEPAALVELFEDVATAIRAGLDELADWGRADGHDGQYRHDVVADDIAIPMLVDAGLGVVSEESPTQNAERPIVAVIDPIDGSTNASMGLPWFATSIAAVDADGLVAGVVVNQALAVTYSATRGGGAFRDGARIAPSACSSLDDAIVIINDRPPAAFRPRQYRVLGAAALDMCAVADGTADAFVDYGVGLRPWDYLGALLVCQEAGVAVASFSGEDLVEAGEVRRNPVVASSEAVRDAIVSIGR